jgi:predicted phage replisome organizer
MGEVKWIKLTTDMFDNRKIKHLRRLPDGNNIVLLWIMLLTMAGRCNAGGMIFLTENIPYTTKMLSDELGFEENTIKLGMQALEQLNMVITDNGVFTIAAWEEYQNTDKLADMREQNRLRQAKYKQKQKSLQGNVTVTLPVTLGNAIEEDKEEDKEKEFHSFILSRESEEEGEEKKRNYIGGTLGKGVVMLSDEQMSDLLEQLSLDEFNKYVEKVADCELSGKHYKKKTHYQAILDMAMKDRKAGRK